MNCQEFWDRAPEDGSDAGLEWAAHRSACPACASAWAAERNLAAGLRQAAAEWRRLGAPARVETRLVSAFREQAGLLAPPRPHGWIAALTWATAAIAVLGLAISLMRVRAPQTASPKPPPANAAILALVEPPDGSLEASENGFLPLPNVEQLAPNEQGDVVRVEVPREAMLALGLEVSPERAAEPVEAEVMLGPDGVARAVRFLDGGF